VLGVADLAGFHRSTGLVEVGPVRVLGVRTLPLESPGEIDPTLMFAQTWLLPGNITHQTDELHRGLSATVEAVLVDEEVPAETELWNKFSVTVELGFPEVPAVGDGRELAICMVEFTALHLNMKVGEWFHSE
jgi:hypothetical protein